MALTKEAFIVVLFGSILIPGYQPHAAKEASKIYVSGALTQYRTNSSFEDLRYHDYNDAASLQYSCARNGSLPCPTWSYCNRADGTCKCPSNITNHIWKCDNLGQISVLECNCMTYNENIHLIEAGYCLQSCVYTYIVVEERYNLLPTNITLWNKEMCGHYNRSGTLCGMCNEGSYPRAYSFDLTCIECTDGESNWWKYVISAFLPLTVFYLIILLFKINIPSSQLQGYVFFSQVVSSPMIFRTFYVYYHAHPSLNISVQIFGSLYGIWNLDFFRILNPGVCLQTDTLATLSLDLAVAVYPLLLMAVTHVMIRLYDCKFVPLVIIWKPISTFFSFFKKNWDIKTSTVDAFATFFFLSNVKFISVCSDLLTPVRVYQFDTPFKPVNSALKLFCDPSVEYFGEKHLPYGLLAIAVLLVFVLFPVMLLILFPFKFCQTCLNVLPRRWQIVLHIFVDSFQGCYKDGTEPGTRDCRWFSATLFIVRFITIIMYVYTLNSLLFPYAAMVIVFATILTIVVDPYKADLQHFSHDLVMFLLLTSCLCICLTAHDLSEIKNPNRKLPDLFIVAMVIVLSIHLLYISVLILCWIVTRRKFGMHMNIIRNMQAWRQGYSSELMS